MLNSSRMWLAPVALTVGGCLTSFPNPKAVDRFPCDDDTDCRQALQCINGLCSDPGTGTGTGDVGTGDSMAPGDTAAGDMAAPGDRALGDSMEPTCGNGRIDFPELCDTGVVGGGPGCSNCGEINGGWECPTAGEACIYCAPNCSDPCSDEPTTRSRNWTSHGQSACLAGLSVGVMDSGLPSVAMLGFNPVVAWVGGSSNQIYITAWDGTDWGGLSSSTKSEVISNSGTMPNSNLSVATDGTKVGVAWVESQNAGPDPLVRFREWGGSAWSAVESPRVGDEVALTYASGTAVASIAFDGDIHGLYRPAGWAQVFAGPTVDDGAPRMPARAPAIASMGSTSHVAWLGYSGADVSVYMRSSSFTAWTGAGGSDTASGVSDDLAAAVDIGIAADGNPESAFTTGASANQIHYTHFNGTSWIDTTGAAGFELVGIGYNPKIARGPTISSAVIAYQTALDNTSQVRVVEKRTGSWDTLGNNDAAPGSGINPSLAISNSEVCLAWESVGGVPGVIMLRCMRED